MGLRNKEMKKLEMRLEFLEFLKEYGIEPNDLHYLHEALEYVKKIRENDSLTNNISNNAPNDDMKKKIKEQQEKLTPEEFINMFAGESEEFYPYGKPKEKNNN